MPELEISKATDPKKWKILIVDDDEDVRMITQLVLKPIIFEGRKLEFIFAATSHETITMMQSHSDISVILMDMKMESSDAGFIAVDKIRNYLKNHEVRIIIRTGQREDDLEEAEFFRYDINGFREKTLSAKQLIFTVVGALRSYRDIIRFQREENSIRNRETVLQGNKSNPVFLGYGHHQ